MVERSIHRGVTAINHRIEATFGNFRVVEYTPLEQLSEIPILLVPGWSASTKHMGAAQQLFAEKGYRSFSFNFPRIGGRLKRNPNYSTSELRKAYALLTLAMHTDSKKFDVVAHSEGAKNSVIAASLIPSIFRNMVLIDPAGIVEDDSLLNLGIGFSECIAKTAIRQLANPKTTRTAAHMLIHSAKHAVMNPVRAYSEAKAVPGSNINEPIQELRDSGIGIGAIYHTNDNVFPIEHMQQATKPDGFDEILHVSGFHTDIYTRPEQDIDAIENMLTVLKLREDNSVFY